MIGWAAETRDSGKFLELFPNLIACKALEAQKGPLLGDFRGFSDVID